MATWKSYRRFEYMDDNKPYGIQMSDYFDWEYGTCADVLTINETSVNGNDAYTGGELLGSTRRETYGQDQAKALYLTLRHWIRRFYGDHVLEQLDKEV